MRAGQILSPRELRSRAGFTLIELMIVVATMGILSALAIPAYTNYVYRARAAEGVHMLAAIGSRQEAYFAEFGVYANVSGGGYTSDWASARDRFTPDATNLHGGGTAWDDGSGNPFAVLGIRNSGLTYLSYACVSGNPSNPPGAPINMRKEMWWVAAAVADLDSDDNYLTIELTSQSRRAWLSSANGFE